MGLALTAHDVAALEERTEGWIAALQLAALSMQGRADLAGFIAGFSVVTKPGSARGVSAEQAADVLFGLLSPSSTCLSSATAAGLPSAGSGGSTTP
ncbi:MAG: hypothetical protein L0H84_17785 [Pseudonocardia sp.]|nr:hypothetical protein [Pseudonocardia sp.]